MEVVRLGRIFVVVEWLPLGGLVGHWLGVGRFVGVERLLDCVWNVRRGTQKKKKKKGRHQKYVQQL